MLGYASQKDSFSYASFGDFCVQTGQLFEPHGRSDNVNVQEKKSMKNANFLGHLHAHCGHAAQIIDQFGHKSHQKKRK